MKINFEKKSIMLLLKDSFFFSTKPSSERTILIPHYSLSLTSFNFEIKHIWLGTLSQAFCAFCYHCQSFLLQSIDILNCKNKETSRTKHKLDGSIRQIYYDELATNVIGK